MSDLPSPLVAPISSKPVSPSAPVPTARADERRGLGVGGVVLAIVTIGALAHVAVRIKSIEVAYALGRERHVATELEEQRRRLQIEIGMLKDPGRVVTIARDKLKMGPPDPDAIRAIGDPRPLLEAIPAPAPAPHARLAAHASATPTPAPQVKR
jgi:cell division protein FtsL